ncbi:hypothetical protein [Polyangium fumosum]|uniref:hypothetical protein n=1 Tax=Polyangium fumosum TaxID=889272 RepID=UPI0010ADBDB2|nr:hypothetical protein [Polyangium fumosum]
MATTLKVTVFDVDNRPIENCYVAAGVWDGAIDALVQGSAANEYVRTMSEPLPNETWTMVVTHSNYVAEFTRFNPSTATWSNPTCEVTRKGSELLAGRSTTRQAALWPRNFTASTPRQTDAGP